MSFSSRRPWAFLLIWIAFVAPSLVHAAPPLKVVWEQGGVTGAESLLLAFDSAAPRLSVAVMSGGLDVWLPGVFLAEPPATGIQLGREAGGTRLLIARPGVALRSVEFEDKEVRIRMALAVDPANAAAATTPDTRSDSSYRIGVGDIVNVTVYKNLDLSGEFPVAHDGTINLPLAGPIPARGFTDTELAARIAKVLDKDLLIDPQVSVSVKTYQSQWVYVTGAVARAVRVALEPGLGLKDALSEAGVALGPGQVVVLTRAAGAGETATLDAEALDNPGAPLPRDGDVLTVSDPAYVFIQGEVRRPGRFPLTPSMTVLQAISLAEGLTEWANKKDVRILRSVGQEMLEEEINLKRVEDRKDADPTLKPGDLILVRRRVL